MYLILFMNHVIEHHGEKYVCLEKLAYGHHCDGTYRKKLFHDVYVVHDEIPFLFVRGGKVLRSEQEADFIRNKLGAGLLYALEKYTKENHSQYWKK